LPENNPLARVAGDEFCIIVPDLESDAALDRMVARIFEAFDAPFIIQGREVFTTVTIGSAVYPDTADGPEQVLRYADLAMSAGRKSGVNGSCRFTGALGAGIERRSRIAALLRSAFARNEFHLAYQPLVDAQTGQVVSAEALLRWNSAELGVVGPDQFIPVAEENGMIIPIGTWTLERACIDATEWCRSLGRDVGVAVNVSPRQLLTPGFPALVADVLARTGLTPDLLKIEVTEGSLVADVDLCRQVLQDLRALGVILALDDFGTGYSALSYLQQFEFDILKLDQSFIRKTRPGTPGAALAASIIAMATCLGMKTVGEGVENEGHVEMLKSNGCNLMQGYLFSSPISRQALEALINEGPWDLDPHTQQLDQAA
jgi:EAL domain-containing protein (putative c-di-GMP-specific phosphodiesterase class I)